MKTVAFVTNSSFTLLHFRMPMMLKMKLAGYDVLACAPRDEASAAIERAGIRFVHVPMNTSGRNPFAEFVTVLALWRIYIAERPNLVHHFSTKAIVYGLIAARLAGIRNIFSTVTGLGYGFSGSGTLTTILVSILKVCRLKNTIVIFQNPDDKCAFEGWGLSVPSRSEVIYGSGVDVQSFVPAARQGGDGHRTFLLFSRMIWAKGIKEYCTAAKTLSLEAEAGLIPSATFVLVGGALPGKEGGIAREWLDNPDAIPGTWLQEIVNEGVVRHFGHASDVRPYLDEADVVVLPSYYPEGLPRSLLEAMSCGRAIVTTDMPGCREAVSPGQSGILIPPRNAEALADAMRRFIVEKGLAERMGDCGRQRALNLFSNEIVTSQYFALYQSHGLAR